MTWNGADLPPEFRELPAGRYMAEAVEDDAPSLTPNEEAGIEAALESCRSGRVVRTRRRRGARTPRARGNTPMPHLRRGRTRGLSSLTAPSTLDRDRADGSLLLQRVLAITQMAAERASKRLHLPDAGVHVGETGLQ